MFVIQSLHRTTSLLSQGKKQNYLGNYDAIIK